MNVVQILPELNEGGVERGVIESNREYVLKGINSTVISAGGKHVETIVKDGGQHIQIDVCSKNILTIPIRVLKLRKALALLNPDIVHVRSRVPAWLVKWAHNKCGYNVISTVHGFNSVGRYSAVMQNADAIICVSRSIKEYIQKHYDTPDEKITVIPRGIDVTVFNPNNLDTRFINEFEDKYGLSNKFVVASVGRITQLKDYETFIRAISLVSKTRPQVVGLIVGGIREDKQDYFMSLQALVDELGLHNQILFVGSHSKIAEIYALSDVVVSCSKKPESFGRSVAESIAVNTPVIATNHGGVKDIIQDGVNGYFFDVGDAQRLAENILNAETLQFDGYNYIACQFSLSKMIDSTIRVYEMEK